MLKIGIIGCGYWGPNLVRNFAELDDFAVSVVCDLQDVRLSSIQTKYPYVEISTNADEVLDDPSIDAVAIATPISTHFGLAKRALEAGKHVFVEKPITSRAAEAEILCEEAERRGLTLMVDHIFLFNGAVMKTKELIDEGKIGEIFYFDSVRLNLGLFQHDFNVIWDLASHDVSIMEYLLDKSPLSVSAVGSCHFHEDLENIAYVNVQLEDNVLAHFHVNWLSPVKVRQILIGGSDKMVLYDDLKADEKLCVYDKGVSITPQNTESVYKTLVEYRTGDMLAPKLDRTEPLRLACQHFADCIYDRTTPISDGPFALKVVRILEAAEKSLRNQGERISL
jgi:predicted dehydrogenase